MPRTWVIFDSDLSFNRQVNAVVRSSFFQLRTIIKMRHFLSSPDLEKIIHGLISSKLDYCNSLYQGISQATLSSLQLVQNADAWLLTRSNKQDHITSILASLHWLLVHFRMNFKIFLVYKSLHVSAPTYISRSTAPPDHSDLPALVCQMCPVHGKNRPGKGALSIAAPRLWNSLPEAIRQCH